MNAKYFLSLVVANAIFFSNSIHAEIPNGEPTEMIEDSPKTLSSEERALLYLSCAYSNLTANNYREAFEDCRRAGDSLSDSSNPEMEFLTSFGMAVACDQLHMPKQAQEHASRLKSLLEQAAENPGELVEEQTPEEGSEMVDQLSSLACLSATPEVRDSLLAAVSAMAPFSEISHSRADRGAVLQKKMRWDLLNPRPIGLLKKCEKMVRKVFKAWKKIYEVYRQFREIEDDLKGRISHEKMNWELEQ